MNWLSSETHKSTKVFPLTCGFFISIKITWICLSIIGWWNVASLASPGRTVSFFSLHFDEWISLSLRNRITEDGEEEEENEGTCVYALVHVLRHQKCHMPVWASDQPNSPSPQKSGHHRHHHQPSLWPKRPSSSPPRIYINCNPLCFKNGIIILCLQSCKFLHAFFGVAFHALGPSFSTWLGSSLLHFIRTNRALSPWALLHRTDR